MLALLGQYGPDAKVLAGGQSLVPLLNMRLAAPAYLVDINHIAALNYIKAEDGCLAVGAAARQRQVERSALVRQQLPLLVEVVQHIGHMQIRNRGTIAGSIAHADPAAELPALLVCLNGVVVAQSTAGTRFIDAEEFFTGYLSTTLQPDELVTEVRFPSIPPQAGWAFLEFARRSGDYAPPVRAHDVETLLIGTTLDDRTLDAAAEEASRIVSAELNDVHATPEYRRALTAELTKRVLRAAWDRRKP